MEPYHGSCHCGTVKFEVDIDLSELTRCTCSMCSKKGGLFGYVLPEQFRQLYGEGALTLYQFNTKLGKHYFCKHCGIHPFVRPRINPKMWLANIRCLEGVDLQTISPVLFDGQKWEQSARALVKGK